MKPNWTFAILVAIVLANINWWLVDHVVLSDTWTINWVAFILAQGAAFAIWVSSDDLPLWVRGLAWPVGIAGLMGTLFSLLPDASQEGMPLWTLVFAVQSMTVFVVMTIFRFSRGDGFSFELSSLIVMTASLGIAFGLMRWSQARWNWQIDSIEQMVFVQAIAVGGLSGLTAMLIWLACRLDSWRASFLGVVVASVLAMVLSYGALHFADRWFDSPRPPFQSDFVDMAPFILPQCVPMAIFFLIGRIFRVDPDTSSIPLKVGS